MATDFRERSALRIPIGSTLIMEVASETATQVHVTALINADGDTEDHEAGHDELWNTSFATALGEGFHVAEIDLAFHREAEESVLATMRIVDDDNNVLRSWKERFDLTAPWMGVMQYLITVK